MEECRTTEPAVWTLSFQRTTHLPWLNRLPMRFRHVAACHYLAGLDAWLFYDVRMHYTRVVVLRGDAANAEWQEFARDAVLLTISTRRDQNPSGRVGFWCVPAIKHLIGLRSSALLPSGLLRDCLAAGGLPLELRHADISDHN